MNSRLIAILSVIVAVVALSLLVMKKHTAHDAGVMDHGMHTMGSAKLSEGGQSAFAALIEVVALLENDTDTAWEEVNIDGLHAHLVDMNRLILESTVVSKVMDNQISFEVSGIGEVIDSIQSMVPAHAGFIQQSRGWSINTELNATGAKLTIKADNKEMLTFLKALGFYGFMSLDSHHQMHHYQMAMGASH